MRWTGVDQIHLVRQHKHTPLGLLYLRVHQALTTALLIPTFVALVSAYQVLRMFNLCDITPRQTDSNVLQQQSRAEGPQGAPPEQKQASANATQQQEQQQQHSDAAGGELAQQQAVGGAAVVDEAGLPALPAHLQPLQALKGAELEARERESEARFKARQRARMADMGMLLDVVLASSSEKLKKEWVTCGILTQLQQALGRLPFTQDYSVVLVKVVGVLEHLPITSDDLYTMRSAHGTFADLIRRMASSATDWEVRRRSHQLLKRYSAASCSDATLLQLYNLPGPNGKPYLLSLHLPPPQLSRLTAMLPKSEAQPRRRINRRRTPPIRGPGPPPGPWPPPMHGPPGSLGPPMFGAPPGPVGDPHSSPSTSHGGPGGHNSGLPAAGAAAQEGGSSMAADSSGGWPPQQQWEGSGLPPPPWAAGGGAPPHLPPPGFRPGRHPRHMGWPPGGPPYGGPPRPGSSGAMAGPSGPQYGPGPSPGDWPERPESAGPGNEGAGAAGMQHSGPAGDGRGFAGPPDRSPGPDGGFSRGPGHHDGPWGPPEWQDRPPRGDWDPSGGRYPGRFGPGPPGPYEGGPLPYSFRERERERQRGWGRRDPEWESDYDRGRERDWGARGDEGLQGGHADRQYDAEAAAAKRQRRELGEGPGSHWPPHGPHDMPPHRLPPAGGWHEGPYSGRDEPQLDERGWRQRDFAAGPGRGSRQGWGERQPGYPAADPLTVPPGASAAVEDLFVLGVYDSLVSDADWQAWCDAVGPAGAEGALSPIVSGRFSPVLPGAAAGGRDARPRSPQLPPGEPGLAMEEVFSVLQDPVLATRTPGVAISACVAGAAPQQQQQQPWRQGPSPAGGGWEQGTDRGQPRPHNHHAAGRQLQGTPGEGEQQHYPDSWDQPGPDFEAFVGESVKHRLGKYVQPDHPNRITKDEAQQLYK